MDAADPLVSPYPEDSWAARLGLEIDRVEERRASVTLPFRRESLNLGGRLHGGVMATALVEAGKVLTRALLDDPTRAVSPMDFQIFYLRPGGKHSVRAEAHLLRRTRSLVFVAGELHDEHGHRLATASMVFRAFDAELAAREDVYPYRTEQLPAGPSADHPLAERINARYEEQGYACRVRHLEPGLTFIEQPVEEGLLDPRGNFADGYLLFLFDRVGSVASGSLARGRTVTVTVDFQLSFCAVKTDEPLMAAARTLSFQGEITHNRVEIHGRDSGRPVVTGMLSHLLRPAAG